MLFSPDPRLSMNFDRFLDQLSPTELSSLRAKVASRESPQEANADPDDPDLEAVFRALSAALGNYGHHQLPYRVFQGKQDFGPFRKKAVQISKYIKKAFQPKSTVEFDFCCKLCFRLLGQWLQDIGVPLGYRTLVNNSDRVPSLIDQAFPGYISAGILNRVIQANLHHGRARTRSLPA